MDEKQQVSQNNLQDDSQNGNTNPYNSVEQPQQNPEYTPPEDFDAKVARMEAQKVINLKYKTFILVIFIFCWFWWGNFQDAISEVNILKDRDAVLQQQKSDMEAQAQEIADNQKLVEYLNTNANKVANCINSNWLKCKDNSIGNIPEARNYLLISQSATKKMDFDQKRILANIDMFLLKNNLSSSNGEVQTITFASSQPVDKSIGLYKVPITLTIDFNDNKALLSFIQNIERKIFLDNPMLYKILSVNYDITKYNEIQSVTLTIEAYFYK